MSQPGVENDAETGQRRPRRHRSRGITAWRVYRTVRLVALVVPEMGAFGWVAVGVLVLLGLVAVVLLVVVLIVVGHSTSIAQDWHYQCDSAIGPDPAVTETDTPEMVTETMAPSDVPTANPYTSLTFGPGDDASSWDLACASAMPSAVYQLPPLQTIASGPAVDCIRQIALAFLGQPSPSPAGLTQDALYQASQADSTGRCQVPNAATGVGAASNSVAITPAPAAVPVAGVCPRTASASRVVLLPNTLSAQGICGQRVATTAISPGDLVFWNYSNHAPASAGVAISASQVLTTDPSTGRVVAEAMPTGSGVRVKRVLAGGS